MIAIIDYDAGNLKSVAKALEYLSAPCIVTRDPEVISSADKVILPGVGSFGDAMERLTDFGLVDVIRNVTGSGVPFLGICLGFQLIFQTSDESPKATGLGLLQGRVRRIPDKDGLKIPQIGWNSLDVSGDGRLFRGLPKDPYVYFVHSYYLDSDEAFVTARTFYGKELAVAVEKGNIFGTQFHPEKSGDIGLAILKNFTEM